MNLRSGAGDALRLRVRSRKAVSPTVAAFVLEDPDGRALPPWRPGAHIDVAVPGGERQFSLCGDPDDATAYRIGVLREIDGTGGSAWIHDQLHEGDLVTVSAPSNHFELLPAQSYLLIAGGIGITPLLSMARQLDEDGANWRLIYLGRTGSGMAFVDELQRYGDRVTVHASEGVGRLDIAEAIGAPQDGMAIYACGPEELLRGVETAAADWPGDALHVERFAPKDPSLLLEKGGTFEVELSRSGKVLEVPPGESILATVEAAGVAADYSCREGTCGTCETRILAGIADHRDSILSPAEQEANDVMMICVSRSKTPKLVLDL